DALNPDGESPIVCRSDEKPENDAGQRKDFDKKTFHESRDHKYYQKDHDQQVGQIHSCSPKARGRSATLTPAHIFPASCVPRFLGVPARAAAYSNPLAPDSRAQIAYRTKVAPLRDDILRWAKSGKSLASTPRPPARCLSQSARIRIWYLPESGPA